MDSYRAIENLLYLYGERIDAGDLEGTAELFRYGAIVAQATRQRVEGYDAVLAMYRQFARIHEDGTPRTQHIITNPRIRVDDQAGRAEASSRFTVFQATETLPLQAVMSGRYEDRLVRIDGQWWFGERTMIPVLYGDVSEHLLTDPRA